MTTPAERYAAFRQRYADDGPALRSFRSLYDFELDDFQIDACRALEAVSKAEFLRVFPSVYRGTHVGHRAVSVRRARSVRVEAPDVVAYADGERVGAVPVDCEVRPGALRVIS